MAVTVTLLLVSVLSVSIGGSVNSDSTSIVTTTLTGVCCTVIGQASLTVHVAIQNGDAIPDALVTIGGTFSCFVDGQFCPLLDVKSAKTDSNGDAYFSVYPLANYNVTVTLPETLENPAIIVTQIKAPGPTFRTTLDVVYTQATTNVSLPPTYPQTTNTTLEYDLTNRLREDGAACTFEWGPMFALYRTGDEFGFNFSSTSPIDVYVFDAEFYSGTVSCTYGPVLHAPYEPFKLNGTQGRFWPELCLGCEKEGGKGSFSYVLFISQDPSATPHVTLEAAVVLYASTTTTTVSPTPSAVPFIGLPETLLAIFLGFFVATRIRRRRNQ